MPQLPQDPHSKTNQNKEYKMIKIETRQWDKYLQLDVEVGGAKFDLGFQSKEDAVELVDYLKSVIDDVSHVIDGIESLERNTK